MTGFGESVDVLWRRVCAGETAIRPLQRAIGGAAPLLAVAVYGDVHGGHDDAAPADLRERGYDLALRAADEAMGGLSSLRSHVPPERWAVVVANSTVGIASRKEFSIPRPAGAPFEFRRRDFMSNHTLAEALSAAHGFRGPSLTFAGSCSTGSTAVGAAGELVRQNWADAVLIGGAEVLEPYVLMALERIGLISPHPCNPFSSTRAGLTPGEGAAILVMTTREHAERAGLRPLAEVRGYASTADGYNLVAPDPKGHAAGRAIRNAAAQSGIDLGTIKYVNAHGTGTVLNDRSETNAVKVAFGALAQQLAMSSTKGATGHLGAVAGVLEAVVTVQAVRDQVAPPTVGDHVPDPACDLDCVPARARPLEMPAALSNSFGFSGTNCTVVFAREGAVAAPPATPAAERVVVTGLGLISPYGIGTATLLSRLSGSRPDSAPRLSRVEEWPEPVDKSRARDGRFHRLASAAARQALTDAGLVEPGSAGVDGGVVLGSAWGPIDTEEQLVVAPLSATGEPAVRAALFPLAIFNSAAGLVAIKFGLVGVNESLSVGQASGAAALAHASSLVRRAAAGIVVCIAADCLTDRFIGALETTTGSRAEPMSTPCEAGAALVLEPLSRARQRRARVLGEVLGWGAATDGIPIGARHGGEAGFSRAIHLALQDAGVPRDAVSQLWSGRFDADEGWAHVQKPFRRLGDFMGAEGIVASALALHSGEPAGLSVVSSSTQGGTHWAIVLRTGIQGCAES